MYGPLLFFFLLVMICIWESAQQLQRSRYIFAALWLSVAILALIYSYGWHLIQFPIALLAVIVLLMTLYWKPPEVMLRQWWARISGMRQGRRYLVLSCLVILGIVVVVIGPRAVDTAGIAVLGGQRVHLTPWDNVFSLVRLILVTNVILWVWWKFSHHSDSPKSFNSWLLTTGVLSGFAIAMLMNQHWIFYTRYLSLSVTLMVLGASALLANVQGKYLLACALSIYLLLNALVATTTYAAERSNIKAGVSWLSENTSEEDVILASRPRLTLNGGAAICNRTILIEVPISIEKSSYDGKGLTYVSKPSGDYPYLTGDNVLSLLETRPSSEFYFLYTDSHEFREILYEMTTGRKRSPINSLFTLLRDGEVGPDIGPRLHASGLKKLDRAKLIAALETRNFP